MRWKGLLLACALAAPAWAQTDPGTPPAPDHDDSAEPQRLRWRNAALIGTAALGVAAYGQKKWWSDGFTGSLRTEGEGWFGQNTRHGGADKLGHAMFTYTGARLGARAFEALGNDPKSARRLGLWTSLGILGAVEVVDGFSKAYRFSPEDFTMNLAGAGLAWLLETRPELDALLDLRLHYLPSRVAGRRHSFEPFADYGGQTYVLAFKGSGMPALRQHPVGRYVEFLVGYGARAYAPEFAGIAERSRHLYVGVGLNLAEVLRGSAFRDDPLPSRTQRLTETFLEYVQVPGTAAVVDHRL